MIESTLEREFGELNVTRDAALSSISGESTKRTLTKSGKNFKWSDLKNSRISFVECCAEKNEKFDINAVQEWVDSK